MEGEEGCTRVEALLVGGAEERAEIWGEVAQYSGSRQVLLLLHHSCLSTVRAGVGCCSR